MGWQNVSTQAVYAGTNLNYTTHNLKVQNTWQTATQILKKGTLVLMMDPKLPRQLWPVGEVSCIIPGLDELWN